MSTRRRFLSLGAIALTLAPAARAQRASRPEVLMYKNVGCSCCGRWAAHMEANGYRVRTVALPDITGIKESYGVPVDFYSCHTALIGDYVVEGHVPAADVNRLLRERLPVKGLAVPGMPTGAPGMGGPPQAFASLAFDGRGGSRIFERH